MQIDNYQPRRLLWPVSPIDVQRIMLGFLVEGHVIYILCQIHVQVVEYIFDDQPLNSEQVSDSHMFVNLHQQPQLQETACGY